MIKLQEKTYNFDKFRLFVAESSDRFPHSRHLVIVIIVPTAADCRGTPLATIIGSGTSFRLIVVQVVGSLLNEVR